MYSVLIVDDEHLVRYGIKSMIDWEKIGFTVVGDASNGKEGLLAFEQHKPDVIITDIKMPVMDGLEMIGRIRDFDKSSKVIVLTCMQDFEFARTALRMGAADYLIKSDMMPDDLQAVMVGVKEQLDSERGVAQAQEMNVENIEFKENIAKEKFLWELSQGTLPRTYLTDEHLSTLGLTGFSDHLTVWMIGMDYLDKKLSTMQEDDKHTFLTETQELIRTVLATRRDISFELFSGQTGIWNVLCLSRSGDERESVELAAAIIDQFRIKLNCTVTIGISSTFAELIDIHKFYGQAAYCYRQKLFLGCGKLFHADRLLPIQENSGAVLSIHYKKLNEWVYALNRHELHTSLHRIFEEAARTRNDEKVHMLAIELLMNLTNIYAEMMRDSEQLYERKKQFYEEIKWLETIDDYREWFLAAYDELISHIADVYNEDKSSIDKVVRYIEEHYQEELSLQQLSEYAHLSKNYFANLFKKEVGESFVEYVTRIRMDKAKLLLESTELKISQIGPMVGITDSKYFSKVFKKITGISPLEYRENYKVRKAYL